MKVRVCVLIIAILQLLDIKHVVIGLSDLQHALTKNTAKYQRLEKACANISFLNLYHLNADEAVLESHELAQQSFHEANLHLDESKNDDLELVEGVMPDSQEEGTDILNSNLAKKEEDQNKNEPSIQISQRSHYSLVLQPRLFHLEDVNYNNQYASSLNTQDTHGKFNREEKQTLVVHSEQIQSAVKANPEVKSQSSVERQKNRDYPFVIHSWLFWLKRDQSFTLQPPQLWKKELSAQDQKVPKTPIQEEVAHSTQTSSPEIIAAVPPSSSSSSLEQPLEFSQKTDQLAFIENGIQTEEAGSPNPATQRLSRQEDLAFSDEAPDTFVQQRTASTSQRADTPIPEEQKSYTDTFNIQRMYLSYAGGTTDDTGYGTNYGTLGVLLGPVYKSGSYLPLVDLRVHRFFDDNTYAANGGIVVRFVPPADDSYTQVWGVNAFFDYREGKIGNYPQLGIGMESLGTSWDFRLNTYIPLRDPNYHKRCVYTAPGGFTTINHKDEFGFYGANAEVGYYFYQSRGFILYGAAGPYGWARKGDQSVLGGEIRVRPQYRDYIALDLRLTYDPIYQTVFQGELIISFPLYQITSNKRKMGLSPVTDRQVYQRVERFEILPYDRSCCWQTNY